ncbi:MAG TPA: 4Fe-4S binding protein [candidate division Zixibacteria bacterium]|nr:4Fe-4S binding protein [candidate division Zixibacteria bacterium]
MNIRTVRNLRRASQIFFFGLFFWLILRTNFDVGSQVDSTGRIILPYPVSIALEFDPLTALSTLLANGTLYKGLLWSLVILIPTIFIGRFFCGWICPLGTLNHWCSELTSERRKRRGKGKIESNRYHWYQRIKYYLLFFMLAAALFGSLQTGLLDPLPLLARSLGTVVLPTVHTAALGTLGWVSSLGWPPLTAAAQFVYDLITPMLLNFRQMHFHGILTIALLFGLILIANRFITRFWCRGICPLGALLGLFSRFAVFGLVKDKSTCDHCGLCVLACQGGDDPEIGRKWRQAECHLCLNCQAVCPQGSLKFKFFPHQEDEQENPATEPKIDISRRKTVVAIAAGVAAVPLLRSGDAFEVNANPKLIRPPGSVAEADFLSRCIRCGQCMRVCPNNALHPTMLESGLEGIWTPILIPRIGYCEPTCTLCGEVCPTGAILHLTQGEKVGDAEHEPNRIGTAFIDHGRCLPWGMARPCIVCEEWCPTTPKAIYLETVTVSDREGSSVEVKRPHVDPAVCTGCGACEFACPVVDRPAVYVTSVGESRSRENQILLERNKQPLADG